MAHRIYITSQSTPGPTDIVVGGAYLLENSSVIVERLARLRGSYTSDILTYHLGTNEEYNDEKAAMAILDQFVARKRLTGSYSLTRDVCIIVTPEVKESMLAECERRQCLTSILIDLDSAI